MAYYEVSGTVKGKDGAPGRRLVVMLNQENGKTIDSAYSDFNTGEYKLFTSTPDPVTIVCMPRSDETANGMLYSTVTPRERASAASGLGVGGTMGFGVGVSPTLPADFTVMDGFNDPFHDNYGNYIHTASGSIMVFIPAFWYKWGTGTNGLLMNELSLKTYSDYPSEAAANLDGYAIHRSFINGGSIRPGFFIDKYFSSKVGNMPASVKYGDMLMMSTYTTNFPGVVTTVAGIWQLAKIRGSKFSPPTAFMMNALQMISYFHVRKSTNRSVCEYWRNDGITKFPLGIDSTRSSYFDATITCYHSTHTAGNRAGSVFPFNSNSHNGQANGVFEIAGTNNTYAFGLSFGSVAVDNFTYVLKESVDIATLTGDNTTNTGVTGANGLNTNYNKIPYQANILTTGFAQCSYDSTKQIFSSSVDRASHEYVFTNIGVTPFTGNWVNFNTGVTAINREFGGSTVSFQSKPNISDPVLYYGGSAQDNYRAGIWTVGFSIQWANSYALLCPRFATFG